MSSIDPNNILAIVAGISGVILGFLLDSIKSLLVRPKLTIEYNHSNSHADAMKLPLNKKSGRKTNEGYAYYFQMRVINKGRVAAKSVEVFANTLEQKNDMGKYVKRNLIPFNLSWAFGRQLDPNNKRLIYYPSISPEMGKHCDIGQIHQPTNLSKNSNSEDSETNFHIDLVNSSSSDFHILQKGDYRLGVIIAATNSRPKKHIIKISLSGEWFDDEKEMLNNGIDIGIVE